MPKPRFNRREFLVGGGAVLGASMVGPGEKEKLMHAVDSLVSQAATKSASPQEQEAIEEEIENEILSAVEGGEKEGVVDEEEREMIERVIAFHDTTVGQIMTPRPEIFALDVGASLDTVKAKIAQGQQKILRPTGDSPSHIGISAFQYQANVSDLFVGFAVHNFTASRT